MTRRFTLIDVLILVGIMAILAILADIAGLPVCAGGYDVAKQSL